jgi:hypothetical protein
VRVVTRHEIPQRAPLRIFPGDEVFVGSRDTTWPAFVFIRAAHGEGWIPARHLAADIGRTVVTTAYDTTELPTDVDQELDVLVADDESGWLWCRNEAGREGWVPIDTVVPIE